MEYLRRHAEGNTEKILSSYVREVCAQVKSLYYFSVSPWWLWRLDCLSQNVEWTVNGLLSIQRRKISCTGNAAYSHTLIPSDTFTTFNTRLFVLRGRVFGEHVEPMDMPSYTHPISAICTLVLVPY